MDLTTTQAFMTGGALGGIFAAALGIIILFFIVMIALYVYTALAWYTIAKKLGHNKPWLAWIPIANYFLLPMLAGKKWTWGFMFLVPIANIVFAIIWCWKILEQRNYPGWICLIPLISLIPPLMVLGVIAKLIIIGLVAWVDR